MNMTTVQVSVMRDDKLKQFFQEYRISDRLKTVIENSSINLLHRVKMIFYLILINFFDILSERFLKVLLINIRFDEFE